MNLLKKLFRKETVQDKLEKNKKLIQNLLAYNNNPDDEKYQVVFQGLFNDDFYLLVPSENDGQKTNLEAGDDFTITSMHQQDGMLSMVVFSSEKALLEWSETGSEYTLMKAQDVIGLCEEYSVSRLVIDPNQATMFSMERNRENVETEVLEEDIEVQVGPMAKPIGGSLLQKLLTNFKRTESIEEAYQYVMVRNQEAILMIGFKLSVYSDFSRKACMDTIINSMENEELDMPLELFFLEDPSWYETVKNINNSLIYRK